MSFQGFPVIINAPRSESDVIKWVLGGLISREAITILGGGSDIAYEIGTVFGQITQGAQTVHAAVAFAGNTGTGTVGSLTGDANIMAGDWKVVVVHPNTNAGVFLVLRPDGTLDGTGNVAAAYNGGLNFTISDATDFVAGDGFTISVTYAAGSGKYVVMDPSATDGSQIAAAILYSRTFVPASVDTEAGAVVRDAVVIPDPLIWLSGITTDQITAALAQLKTHRIYTKALV